MSCFLRKMLKICIRGHRTLLLFKVFCPLEQKQGWLFFALRKQKWNFPIRQVWYRIITRCYLFFNHQISGKKKIAISPWTLGKNLKLGKKTCTGMGKKVVFVSNWIVSPDKGDNERGYAYGVEIWNLVSLPCSLYTFLGS